MTESNIRDRFNPGKLYDIYAVTVQVRDRVCGGMPRNKSLIENWVKSTTGYNDEQATKLTQENADLVVNEVAEKSWIGFPEDSSGLFLPARNIKAMLKQSASLLQITKVKRGSKQILAEGMEVKGIVTDTRVYMYTGSSKVTTPSGTDESAIHVMTAQGPRTALRRMDYVTAPKLTFQVWMLATAAQESRHIGEEDLVAILTHAQENGMGASRSQGEGKFDVIGFEKIQVGERVAKAEPKAEKKSKAA